MGGPDGSQPIAGATLVGMHEVSLCRQLAAAVTRATGDREVEAVYVDVGQLRQVVPEAMQFAWTFVVKETSLARARLELRQLPAILVCRDCGTNARLGPELGFYCRACGSTDTELTSGEQFVLTAVDVRTPLDGDTSTGPRTPADVRTTTPTDDPAGRCETDPGKGDRDGALPSA